MFLRVNIKFYFIKVLNHIRFKSVHIDIFYGSFPFVGVNIKEVY